MAQQGRQAGEQGPTRGMIDGPLMLQYLLAMLNQPGGPRGGPGFDFLEGMGGAGAESGRWGDYVFNQEGSFARAHKGGPGSLHPLNSAGPDYHPNHGELPITSRRRN